MYLQWRSGNRGITGDDLPNPGAWPSALLPHGPANRQIRSLQTSATQTAGTSCSLMAAMNACTTPARSVMTAAAAHLNGTAVYFPETGPEAASGRGMTKVLLAQTTGSSRLVHSKLTGRDVKTKHPTVTQCPIRIAPGPCRRAKTNGRLTALYLQSRVILREVYVGIPVQPARITRQWLKPARSLAAAVIGLGRRYPGYRAVYLGNLRIQSVANGTSPTPSSKLPTPTPTV